MTLPVATRVPPVTRAIDTVPDTTGGPRNHGYRLGHKVERREFQSGITFWPHMVRVRHRRVRRLRVRHLKNAPILEALVDFRVTLPKDVDAERFRALAEAVGDRYPIVEAMHSYQASITFQPGTGKPMDARTAEVHPGGYVFRSSDRLNVVQFRVDGFTYNRLRPYTSWDELRPEILRLWGLYQRAARPETCSRITARYINRIDVPWGGELSDFLTAPPILPEGFPDILTGFITRIIIHDPEPDVFASVTQASQVQMDPQSASIILDIEAYRQSDVGALDKQVEPTLAGLHDMKNRIFFGSLSEDQLKRYE